MSNFGNISARGPLDRAPDNMHRQQMGDALKSYGSGLFGPAPTVGPEAFRQELDELVRSIVIDKNHARDLPAFEAACVALGYIYDKDECALYREEIVRVEPKTERVKVL